MSFLKFNKLLSTKVSLALLITLLYEGFEYLKSFNSDSSLKYFLINSWSNLLSTLEICS